MGKFKPHSTRKRQGAHPGRHGAGRETRRARYAAVLHQRTQPARRPAGRGVQEGDRRGDQEGRRENSARARSGKTSTPSSSRTASRRRPRHPRRAAARDTGSRHRLPVEVGSAPVKGGKDALVTIVQISDFQCPFCSRVEPTLDKILEEYKDKVRVAWKDHPLPFHNRACRGARGSRRRCAGQVLGDAQETVREPKGARRRRSREIRARAWLNVAKWKAFVADRRTRRV